jgi:hypothetical protein
MNEIDVVLAECPGLGRVRLCGCKSIHLSIGPVTLNLEPHAFAQTAALIRSAVEQLAEVLSSREEARDPLESLDPMVCRFTH